MMSHHLNRLGQFAKVPCGYAAALQGMAGFGSTVLAGGAELLLQFIQVARFLQSLVLVVDEAEVHLQVIRQSCRPV